MKFAVLADLHFTYEAPISRVDDYFATAIRKMKWVRNYIGEDTPLIIAGDIFDVAKPRNFFKMYASVESVLKNTHTIVGNHDISYHNLSYLPETAYAVLAKSTGCDTHQVTKMGDFELHPFDFGVELQHEKSVFGLPMIAITHEFIYKDKQKFVKGREFSAILKEFPEYAIIISGDNHQHFIEEYEGRYLINNGSLLRRTAGQIDYKPVVTIWEDGVITTVPIPIEADAVSNGHIIASNARELAKGNMLAYMELVKNADREVYDFNSNLLSKIINITDKPTHEVLMEIYTELQEKA